MKKILLLSFFLCAILIAQASPNHITEKKPTKALFQAIEKSDAEGVKAALDDGADVNALYNYPDEEYAIFFAYWRPIHMAAYFGKVDIVLMLLSKEVNVKVKIKNEAKKYAKFEGYTPIHFTASNESEDQDAILDLFMRQGLSINEKGDYGWRPLNAAINSKSCSAKGVQRLIDKGANVNPDMGSSPLSQAINHEENEKFIVIMNAGGDINKEVTYAAGIGDGPCSILDVALYEGNNYLAKMMIEKGADFKSRTSYGYSRLHWCAINGNKSMAYFFMKKGFDPNEKGTNGRSPMSIAKGGRQYQELNQGLVDLFESSYMSKAEQDFYALADSEEYKALNIGKNYKGKPFSAKNIKGGTVTLEKYKGKILFLNIWGTWCPPCVREMPSMQTLYEKMQGKDFAMLASSYEKDFDKIKNFIEAREFTFDVAQDADQSLVKNYPSVMPTSYIIDKKGNVIASMDGSTDWSQEKYIKLFELLVKM